VAHILRELIFIHEQCEQVWAKTLVYLLLDMNRKREEQKLVAPEFAAEQLKQWHQQYKEIIPVTDWSYIYFKRSLNAFL